MLVHILNRPAIPSAPLSGKLFHSWAECLRTGGIDVVEDMRAGRSEDTFESAVESAVAEFTALWAAGEPPDLIHTFGVVATAAALEASPPARVVATFHESPIIGDLESILAAQVHAVISLSAHEHRRWQIRGITSVQSGPIPMPVEIADPNACAHPGGDVVTLGSAVDLDEVLHSMRHWHGRLVVLADLTTCRRTQVELTVRKLGLQDRVDLRPGADRGGAH